MNAIAVLFSVIGLMLFMIGLFRSWKAHFWASIIMGPIVSILVSSVFFLGEEVGVIIFSGITLWNAYLLYLTGKEKKRSNQVPTLRVVLMAAILISWLLSIFFWMVDGTGHYFWVALF